MRGPSTDQTMASEVKAPLARPNSAVISMVTPKRQPVSAATWYLLDGDEPLTSMDGGRKRLEWLEQDLRVALTVLDAEDLAPSCQRSRPRRADDARRRAPRHRPPGAALDRNGLCRTHARQGERLGQAGRVTRVRLRRMPSELRAY